MLYDDKAIALRAIGRDPTQVKEALWVRKRDLPGINEFELKPQGACRADICIPIPKDMLRGEYFNLPAFARRSARRSSPTPTRGCGASAKSSGEAAAGKWYDAAKATFTMLVDTRHTVSSAFHFVNVPMGVWIDERGRVVRPAEPAWTSTRTNTFGGKTLETEGELYVSALRDWVANGDSSQFVLSDDEFARRVQPRSALLSLSEAGAQA